MLRRRIPANEKSPARTPSPGSDAEIVETTEYTESEETSVEEVIAKGALNVHHHHHHSKRPKKRSLWLTFAVGGLVGLFLAGLAKNQDLVNLELIQDLKLESLFDAIPAGILKEASDISVRFPSS